MVSNKKTVGSLGTSCLQELIESRHFEGPDYKNGTTCLDLSRKIFLAFANSESLEFLADDEHNFEARKVERSGVKTTDYCADLDTTYDGLSVRAINNQRAPLQSSIEVVYYAEDVINMTLGEIKERLDQYRSNLDSGSLDLETDGAELEIAERLGGIARKK